MTNDNPAPAPRTLDQILGDVYHAKNMPALEKEFQDNARADSNFLAQAKTKMKELMLVEKQCHITRMQVQFLGKAIGGLNG